MVIGEGETQIVASFHLLSPEIDSILFRLSFIMPVRNEREKIERETGRHTDRIISV